MTQQLIDGLLTAADWIESGTIEYNWQSAETCNCGILAQAITGLPPGKIHIVESIWSKEVNRCDQTGTPINDIIKTLMEAGMTAKDFVNLEFLVTNGKVPKFWWNHEINSKPYTKKENVINYIKKWADRLQKELNNDKKHQLNLKLGLNLNKLIQ